MRTAEYIIGYPHTIQYGNQSGNPADIHDSGNEHYAYGFVQCTGEGA